MRDQKNRCLLSRFFHTIQGKLLLYYLPLSLIPLIIVSTLAYSQARHALEYAAADKLEAVRELKKSQIEDYLSEREAAAMAAADLVKLLRQQAFERLILLRDTKHDATLQLFEQWQKAIAEMAKNPDLVDRDKEMSAGFAVLGAERVRGLYLNKPDLADAGDQSSYSAAHAENYLRMANYARINGYDDILWIDASGWVIYSVQKNAFFGQNVNQDPASSLAILYQQLKTAQPSQTAVTDVCLCNDQAVLLMGTPIYDGAAFAGILVYQLPMALLDQFLQVPENKTQAGEAYLVGADYRMRSNSTLDPEHHSVLASLKGTVEQNGVKTPCARAALAGETGAAMALNYKGLHTICSYAPLEVMGLNWAILVEEYIAEAIVPEVEGIGMHVLTQFAQRYGYQDLILMASDGYVFHTVLRGPDYRTNLITGPYRETHLGRLVQQVLITGKLAFADFAPYLPAGNKPVAFVAAPVLYQGRPDMVVALQLPPGWTNAVMAERTGMGKTGETLLVGPDLRMRSNSYLDPAEHSVEASFVGTVEKNGIDSHAVRRALEGVVGEQVLFEQDYLGNQVIVTYTPVQFGNQNWALIAKQNTAEAFSLVDRLNLFFLITISLAAVTVLLVTIWAARRISNPIFKLASVAQSYADGNLKAGLQVETIRDEELNILANALSSMADQLLGLISSLEDKVQERTAQLEIANKELEAFSYSVSHDLRAPLRAIDGFAHILMEDHAPNLDSEGQQACRIIRDQAQRMGNLIDDLLSFSRLGRAQMQNALIDMSALVRGILNELLTAADCERIETHINPLPSAIGDPAMIRQVWVNLISNAIKYSSKRERALIEVGSQQQDGNTVYYVRDNGAGVDMQYINKLFGVFQRLHSERDFSGTGVGLAIVKRVIQRHHGQVWAESKVDQGTTFYFMLPTEGNTQ